MDHCLFIIICAILIVFVIHRQRKTYDGFTNNLNEPTDCPICGSLNTVFIKWSRGMQLQSYPPKYTTMCNACGYSGFSSSQYVPKNAGFNPSFDNRYYQYGPYFQPADAKPVRITDHNKPIPNPNPNPTDCQICRDSGLPHLRGNSSWSSPFTSTICKACGAGNYQFEPLY